MKTLRELAVDEIFLLPTFDEQMLAVRRCSENLDDTRALVADPRYKEWLERNQNQIIAFAERLNILFRRIDEALACETLDGQIGGMRRLIDEGHGKELVAYYPYRAWLKRNGAEIL